MTTIKYNTPFRLSAAAAMGVQARRDGLDPIDAYEALESKMGGPSGCSEEEIEAFDTEYNNASNNEVVNTSDTTVTIETYRDALSHAEASGRAYIKDLHDACEWETACRVAFAVDAICEERRALPRVFASRKFTATTTVTASNPRPSDCCQTEGALDLDVTVTLPDGTDLDGEVTLVPALSRDGYCSWGEPSHWVSGDLLRAIEDRSDFETVLHVIACEAGLVAEGR